MKALNELIRRAPDRSISLSYWPAGDEHEAYYSVLVNSPCPSKIGFEVDGDTIEEAIQAAIERVGNERS